MVSWKVPIERRRLAEAPLATGAPITGLRRSICSVRVYGGTATRSPHRAGLPDYAPNGRGPLGEAGVNTT